MSTTGAKAQAWAPAVGIGWNRQHITATSQVAVATGDLALNGTIDLLKVPKNAIIISLRIPAAAALDTGAALVVSVGDAAVPARLMAGSTFGQGVVGDATLLTSGFLYQYPADTVVTAKVTTGAGTPVAGTVKFSIGYVVDVAGA